MNPTVECAQCETLKQILESAERHYVVTQKSLSSVNETDATRYSQAEERASEARVDFEEAWLELDKHHRAHALSVLTEAKKNAAGL
jgi:hypothetical protein